MKNKTQILALILLVPLFIFSCRSGKKIGSTTQGKNGQMTKEVSKSNTKTDVKTDVKRKPDKQTTVVKKETDFAPVPPLIVENNFKSSYNNATNVVWFKEVPNHNLAAKESTDYRVMFAMLEMRNSAIYDVNGDLVEIRMQINPDQMPNIVHEKIKLKYTDCTILSASTVKNKHHKGAYVVFLKSQAIPESKEIVITDMGEIIQ